MLEIVSYMIVVHQNHSVRKCVIIHEYEYRTYSTSKQANTRLKYIVSVSCSSNKPRLKNVEVYVVI